MTQTQFVPHEMTMPTSTDEALEQLRHNLSPAILVSIREIPAGQLSRLYARWVPYLLKHSACLTREVALDLDLELTPEGLRHGAEFLLYLLWQELRRGR